MSRVIAPRVSVLMSAYNEETYVREAVDSILNQTFSDFEFIIVDDASTDDTAAILDSYNDGRIVRIRNSENIGLTKSLNRGLRIARGQFIARQDADDVSLPTRLQLQVNYFDANPKVGLLGSAYYRINGKGNRIDIRYPPLSDTEIRWGALFQNPFCHTSIMFRREHVQDTAYFYNEALPFTQDYDLWMRLLKSTHAANLSAPLVALRLHEKSVTRTRQTAQEHIASTIAARAINALVDPSFLNEREVVVLRQWYQRFPSHLNAADMQLCCASLDILKAFSETRNTDSHVLRRVGYQWIDRMLTSVHPADLSEFYSSGLLTRLMREHKIDVLRHLLKRVVRRALRPITRKKESWFTGTKRGA